MKNRIGPEIWRSRYAHPCAWDQQFTPLTLPDMLRESVAVHGDRHLVEFEGRAFTYAALYEEACAFARGLIARGIGKGDHVGLFLPNVPVYPAAFYGTLMAGATLVNFSPLYSAEELEAQVADSGARMMVTVDSPALLSTACTVLRDSALETLVVAKITDMLPWAKALAMRVFGRKGIAPIPRASDVITWKSMLRPGDARALPQGDAQDDLALLQYTGGTTGTPKGAMLTHQNLTANARQVRLVDPERDARDVTLAVLPLFHVFANTCVLNRTLLNGGTLLMQPRFEVGKVLGAIARSRPTSLFAVPTMLQALLDDPRSARTDFSSLREIVSGGAPLPLPLLQRFERETGVKVIEGYGLTECSGVVATNPLAGGERPGTIGQPLPGTDVRLLDKDNPSCEAPEGEPGELVVAGPQVMAGYWNRPDASTNVFVDLDGRRWLRTGDIAVIEDDGFVRIVDRSKDMIAVGGFKVFPSQVEAVVVGHPAVREALVIGVPDAYHGEMPRAFVSLRPSEHVSADELAQWLNDRVGKHERVDKVVIRDDLPKTMVGKLDRKALRAEIAPA